MSLVTNKFCPFNEERKCDRNCQLYINSKCSIAIMADSLVRTEKTLQKIQKEKDEKDKK